MRQFRSGGHASVRESVFAGFTACLESRDLGASRDLYSLVIKTGLDSFCIVGDHLIRLFASCSSLSEALYVFNHVQQPSLYTWNSIISAHIQLGHPQCALSVFRSMPISPDQVTLSCVLQASIDARDIDTGRQAHALIALYGIAVDFVINGTLVRLYAELGSIEEAANVFDGLPSRDVVLWGTIIEGFLQNGQSCKALRYLKRMYQQGVPPNQVVLLLGLRACSAVVQHGMSIHAEICIFGFEKDKKLQSALVEMYSTCQFLEEAESVFERADHADLVLWSSILGAYVHSSNHLHAFEMYERMVASGLAPDKVVFLFLLQACGNLGSISEGFKVHEQITMRGLDKIVVVENALISMYNKCGDLHQANQMFHRMQFRDEVSWTIIITGHVNCGQYIYGLELFEIMQLEGFSLNVSVLPSILIACGNSCTLEEGHLIHEHVIRSHLDNDLCISNGLVYMYCSLGKLKDSQKVFNEIREKDMSSWSSMILGFAERGLAYGVLNCLEAMQCEGLLPDKGVLIYSLRACGLAGALAEGNWVCHLALNHNVDLDTRLACEMVRMYADCGTLQDAEAVFDRVKNPDVALWSSLIAGYCDCGQVFGATRGVGEMLKTGLELDNVSYLSLLEVCCKLGSLEEAKLLHSQIVQGGFDRNSFIHCSVLYMYMKCGSVDDANNLFTKGRTQDLDTGSSMLSDLGSIGNNQMVHHRIERMKGDGFKQTISLLSNIFGACGQSSLLSDGCHYFRLMRDSLCATEHRT